MNMGRESFCWARLREDKEAAEARCQPADSPWSGDTFVDRMPVARNVCAACQRESLGKDGSCWNAETPNRQGLRYVLVLGELVGGGEPAPPEEVRGLFCIVWLKLLSVKHLREGAPWGCNAKCRWRSYGVTQGWELHCTALQTEASQESWGGVRLCKLLLWDKEHSSPNVSKV